MNKEMMIIGTSGTSTSDYHLCPSSPDGHEIFRSRVHFSHEFVNNVSPITAIHPEQQNPRKKRTKMAVVGGNSGSHSNKPKYVKKPDPNAPKITDPCTECGKRFWSKKALYGHMRSHPERPWRGINPPSMSMAGHNTDSGDLNNVATNEERFVASCLLMLANGPSQAGLFECISCKKVFGSHQALGGHRASHKNVKGCFAITKNEEGEEVEEGELEGEHKCNICLRMFSSGEALGGHKRCHSEKEDGDVVALVQPALKSVLSQGGQHNNNLDLNLRLGL